MTTYRADGTAIRLPGVEVRRGWYIVWPALRRWMNRMRDKYVYCEDCQVVRLKADHEAHLHIHDEL